MRDGQGIGWIIAGLIAAALLGWALTYMVVGDTVPPTGNPAPTSEVLPTEPTAWLDVVTPSGPCTRIPDIGSGVEATLDAVPGITWAWGDNAADPVMVRPLPPLSDREACTAVIAAFGLNE